MTQKNLIIHDLNEKEWDRIREKYDGWNVIADHGTIHPCIGCFSCWNKDPGRCVIKDGYQDMGSLIHEAGEVTVISRYTCGGFSGFVKNVIDRCLGYVLPQFEVVKGETHHKKRYEEDKPFTFIFHGHDLNNKEKAAAERYVRAVCANIRGHVKEVIFRETDETFAANVSGELPAAGRTVILNGSMRTANGNSAKLAKKLAEQLVVETEIINLKDYLNDLPQLVSQLEDVRTIVLCMPLYVDGLPSQVIRLLEQFEKNYTGRPKRIYVLANMGLYESSQLHNLFDVVRQWCVKMKFPYCGGLGVSAGELLGTLMESLPFAFPPNTKAAQGMERLAEAINNEDVIGNILAEPYLFPRWLYILIANVNWNRTAKRNGISPEDLYRQL